MKRLKKFFVVYLTQLTKLVKTSQNWLPHAQTILKLSAKVLRCRVELHNGNVFWRKNFDPNSSPGLLTSHFVRENPGDEVDFHPVPRANLKSPIIEATTLNRPSNKRYLKLTSMSFSNKAVIYLPPVSAASWQRNWLASVSAQLKEMVWMGTGFKSWTWASMDDGGWKGKVKGVNIVCCNRDLIWSDNSESPGKRCWKIEFASFQTISRLSQVSLLLKRRELRLELKRRDRAWVQTEMLEFIALQFPSRKLRNFAILRQSCAGTANEFTKQLEAHAELAPLAFC